MTTFAKDNIPASIDTLEKLSTWVNLALAEINSTQTAVEGAGPPIKIAQFGIFNVDSNNTTRVIFRQSFEIDGTFAYKGGKLWEHTKEFSTNALPTGFSDPAS